jgi:nucleoside-diphosphate-sugar epimerase
MTSDTNLGQIAIFGARGAIGHSLTAQLDDRNQPYRVVGRDDDALRSAFPHTDIRKADFLSGEGLDQAATGIDTIFYLAGAPYTHFERHPVMVRNALEAAGRAGVRRFVQIAPVYSYGPARTDRAVESQPHVPNTRKGRWRLEQEQAVLAAHDPGAMRTMVVHLPDFYGPHADNSLANYFLTEAAAGKTATFIGPLDARREFLYVPDAGAPLLALAALDDAFGTRWNLGGTPVLAGDFTQIAFEVLNSPAKVRSVSKTMLRTFGLFNPMMRELAEMYYLYDGNFVLDDSKLQSKLGPIEKTPIRKGIAATIDWIR